MGLRGGPHINVVQHDLSPAGYQFLVAHPRNWFPSLTLALVTILTPFSTSPMTDASVDALPTLFLAYCAIDHADSNLTD